MFDGGIIYGIFSIFRLNTQRLWHITIFWLGARPVCQMWRSGKCTTGEYQKSNWKQILTSFNENQVRDASTGIGKGFGYVNFVAIESVELALRMANQEVEDLFLKVWIRLFSILGWWS